jgi:ribosomal protein L22
MAEDEQEQTPEETPEQPAAKPVAKKAAAKKPAADKPDTKAEEPAEEPVADAGEAGEPAEEPVADAGEAGEPAEEPVADAGEAEEPAEEPVADTSEAAEPAAAVEPPAKKPAKAKRAKKAPAEKQPAEEEPVAEEAVPEAKPVAATVKPGTRRTVVRARARYVRTSARKARMVCGHIRGKSVPEARAILAFTPREVARDWSKLLESAVANAENNHELLEDDLIVREVYADEGPTIKRFRPRAMGRATPIRKRTSHLTITLTPRS